uniref:Fibronectin type-III domain-containing protein n=1 Tax=Erpetoichthys calabaricus TaxID=27687 RepID=A0A8C4SKQ0_ERPCA
MDGFELDLLLYLVALTVFAQTGSSTQPTNLQCHNDYLKEMTCMWKAEANSNCTTLYTLLHQKTDVPNQIKTCFPVNLNPEPGNLSDICTCRISIEMNHSYKLQLFYKDKLLQCSTININDTVKPAMPYSLEAIPDKDDGIFMWTSSYRSQTTQALYKKIYQVKYNECSDMESDDESPDYLDYKLVKTTLGNCARYSFMVRSKLQEPDISEWSAWIPEDEWYSESKELTCHNDFDAEMVCTWNPGKYINCAEEYIFNFRRLHHPLENSICIPRNTDHTPVSYCECRIDDIDAFTSSDKYVIEVWSGAKLIILNTVVPHESIKPRCPGNLKITKNEHGNVLLTWISNYSNKSFMSDLNFDISYRKKDRPEEEAVEKTSSDTSCFYEIIKNSLDPGWTYVVKVRSFNKRYNSQKSDWTSAIEWYNDYSTEDVLKRALPGICVVLIAVIITCYCCAIMVKHKWYDKVPNPRKSNLVIIKPKTLQIANFRESIILPCELLESVPIKIKSQCPADNILSIPQQDFLYRGLSGNDDNLLNSKMANNVTVAPEYQGCPVQSIKEKYNIEDKDQLLRTDPNDNWLVQDKPDKVEGTVIERGLVNQFCEVCDQYANLWSRIRGGNMSVSTVHNYTLTENRAPGSDFHEECSLSGNITSLGSGHFMGGSSSGESLSSAESGYKSLSPAVTPEQQLSGCCSAHVDPLLRGHLLEEHRWEPRVDKMTFDPNYRVLHVDPPQMQNSDFTLLCSSSMNYLTDTKNPQPCGIFNVPELQLWDNCKIRQQKDCPSHQFNKHTVLPAADGYESYKVLNNVNKVQKQENFVAKLPEHWKEENILNYAKSVGFSEHPNAINILCTQDNIYQPLHCKGQNSDCLLTNDQKGLELGSVSWQVEYQGLRDMPPKCHSHVFQDICSQCNVSDSEPCLNGTQGALYESVTTGDEPAFCKETSVIVPLLIDSSYKKLS